MANYVLFCGKHDKYMYICKNIKANHRRYGIDLNINALFFGTPEECENEARIRYQPQGFVLMGYKGS
jgi:hypothetical protein